MASNQPNRSSQWRGQRNAPRPPRSPAPSQASPNRIGQWRQTYERYKNLAESAGAGDEVTREGYWQHAEHYIRMIHEAEALQAAP